MKRIVLTGGGTAGHVSPNQALIPHLLDEGWDIHYIGTKKGIERSLIEPMQGVTYHAVSSGKLRRYFDWKNFTDPFRVIAGAFQSIGVIGTAATIASGSYRKEIERLAPKTEVFEQACPLFVPLVENAFVSPDDPIPRLTAERYLTPIREAGVDTLILGCTHYPIISETIRRVMGENVTLISSGREAAKSCRTVLEENGLLCDGKTDGTQQYFVSDDTESFYKVAELFLGQSVESCVECIDIERY